MGELLSNKRKKKRQGRSEGKGRVEGVRTDCIISRKTCIEISNVSPGLDVL